MPGEDRPLRILVLSPCAAYPPSSGWPTVIYNDIRHLAARGHEMHVLALSYDRAESASDLADVAQAEYFFIHKPPRWKQVLANLGHTLPYTIERQLDRRLIARGIQIVRDWKIDAVLVEDVVMAWCAKLIADEAPVPVFLRGHNISTVVFRRFYEAARNPVIRYLGYRQCQKFARYESAVFGLVNGASQITPADVEEAERLNPRVKQRVIWSGVDLEYFQPTPPEQREPNTLIHVGSLDPITKLPAMVWLYRNVLPRVRAQFPKVRLELAGWTPQSELHEADPSEVVVHGRVPDVRPFLARGAAFVSPQFVGSGIRIKILTAMATGNAVVSTPVACEGLPLTHEKDALIAEDEQDFAECICRLLGDPELRRRIGEEARQLVERRFSWAGVVAELDEELRKAIENHRRRGAASRDACARGCACEESR